MTVAAVMITVFFTFAGRRGVLEEREETVLPTDGDEER